MSGIQPAKAEFIQYQYPSLAPKSRDIRLLTLCPGDWNDEIQCFIRVVSLDLKPVYEAISYAWGSSKDSKAIFLDGHEVDVRSNLESTLRHLRKPSQALSLWADALCIDQDNDAEKTHQVSMMGEIYSTCTLVYIWLGTPESQLHNTQLEISSPAGKELLGDNDRTFAWHNPFSLAQHFAEDKHFSELPGYVTSPSSDASFQFEEEEFRHVWQGFCPVLSSSWWTRLWCVQETLLPPEALAIFGSWSMEWEKFGIAERNRHRHQLSCCAATSKLMGSRFVFNLDNLVLDRQTLTRTDDQANASEQPILDYMLRSYRHKDCQDQRDKVYGLLGLIETRKPRKLLPDYSLLLKDVLINATEAVILESNGDLRFLTGSGFNSQQRGIPTWVRDLTSKPSQSFPESQRFNGYTLYSASKCTVSEATQRDRTKLMLKGFTIDRVRSVGEPVQTRDINHIDDVLKNWHQVADLDYQSHIDFTSNNNQQVFWRTVIGDAFPDLENKWQRLGTSELKAYEQWTSNFPFSANPTTQSPLSRNFLLALRSAICGRAMYTTENGSVGLCEPTTRAGDEVWILHGGRVPFILRLLGRQALDGSLRHAFIGECHMTGFMDGEAFEQKGRVVSEVILE